jgi:hypothetical protein
VPTGGWKARFWQIWKRTPCEQREVLKISPDENPYEACNQRQLEIAQQRSDKITLIGLFDGTADAAGGTRHLIQRVQGIGGQVDVIDTNRLLLQ